MIVDLGAVDIFPDASTLAYLNVVLAGCILRHLIHFIHGFSGFGKIHQKQSNRCSYNRRNGGDQDNLVIYVFHDF